MSLFSSMMSDINNCPIIVDEPKKSSGRETDHTSSVGRGWGALPDFLFIFSYFSLFSKP